MKIVELDIQPLAQMTLSRLLSLLLAVAVFAGATTKPLIAEEEAGDEPTSTQLVLLHERWLAWEPAGARRAQPMSTGRSTG